MAVNKVIYDNKTLIDLTEDTVTPQSMLVGTTAHSANGEIIEGGIETWNGEVEDGVVKEDVNTLKRLLDYSKSCSRMFYENKNIIDLNGYFEYSDTENVIDMSSMFSGCRNLISIPQLNTSKVTTMRYMFNLCTGLKSIPQLDTSNVTTMENIFSGCGALTTIPLLNTSKVTNMQYMFNNCNVLTTIPLLDTSSVTNMNNMFSNCFKLSELPLLDTTNVTTMSSMFNTCSSLTSISQLNTGKVTNMSSIFAGCRNLISIPQLNTSKVTTMSYMFSHCLILPKIDITYYNSTSTSSTNYWCQNCYSLKALIIRSFGTSYALNTNAFNNCYHILGTKDLTYNPNGDKDGYIYVPRDMVDTIKSATNWSQYATQIRALEDYTVDGTIDGELDESKI